MRRRALLGGASLALLTRAAAAQPVSAGVPGGRRSRVFGPGAGAAAGYGPTPGTTGPTLDLNFLTGVLDPRITFARASSGSYFDAAGVMQTAASNAPRFDYDPVTHAARGLLIEESRTNLVLNSAVLSTQSVTVTAAATTLTFYGTGSVALSGTFVGNLAGTGAFPARVSLVFTPTAGTLTLTVTGSVLSAQVETGATATSYIATTGATATRVADVATIPLTPVYPFTLVGEGMVPALSPTAAEGLAVLTDGTTNNRVIIRANSSASNAMGGALVVAAATTAAPQTANTITLGAVFKVGAVSTTTAMTISGNAGAVVTAAGAAPTGLNLLTLGQTTTPGNALNGWLRRIAYWPRALSNGELQAATL